MMKKYVYALITNKQGFLAVKKPINNKRYSDYWGLPGGQQKKFEKEEESVIREVKEETNLFFIPTIKIFEKKYLKEKIIVIVYLGNVLPGEIIISDEHDEIAFLKPSSVFEKKFFPYVNEIFKEVKKWKK